MLRYIENRLVSLVIHYSLRHTLVIFALFRRKITPIVIVTLCTEILTVIAIKHTHTFVWVGTVSITNTLNTLFLACTWVSATGRVFVAARHATTTTSSSPPWRVATIDIRIATPTKITPVAGWTATPVVRNAATIWSWWLTHFISFAANQFLVIVWWALVRCTAAKRFAARSLTFHSDRFVWACCCRVDEWAERWLRVETAAVLRSSVACRSVACFCIAATARLGTFCSDRWNRTWRTI